jgi:hypothetical protein
MGPLRRSGPRSVCFALVVGLGAMVATRAPATPTAAATAPTLAAGAPVVPTYLPAGFIDNTQTAAQVDAELADLDRFGVNRALQNLVGLRSTGTLTLSSTTTAMLPLWVARTAAFDAANGRSIAVIAVLNGRLDKGLNLDDAATRSAITAGALQVVGLGVTGIQLDLEPFPSTPGYLTLLDQLRAAFAGAPTPVQLSVVAPTNTSTWGPAYLAAVSSRVDEVDPTFYDSGIHKVAGYEQWVVDGLAAYSASTAPTARIVPILPSYRSNPWHRPLVENITTATVALTRALAAGDRIDGAGIWWWWGFFYGEGGHYKSAAADQAAWQATTRPLLGA